jgi:YcxB-like protein
MTAARQKGIMADDDDVSGGGASPSSAPPTFDTGWSPMPGLGSPVSVVVVEYQLTEDEVVPGLRRQLLRTGRLRLVFIIGVLLVLLGAFSAVAFGPSFGAFMGVLGILYIALVSGVVIRAPRRAWRRNPALRGPQLIAFGPEIIYARSMLAESRSQWGLYAAMIETDRCYMLQLATRKAYAFVPKRAFKSATDETAFRDMVALHLRVAAHPSARSR